MRQRSVFMTDKKPLFKELARGASADLKAERLRMLTYQVNIWSPVVESSNAAINHPLP